MMNFWNICQQIPARNVTKNLKNILKDYWLWFVFSHDYTSLVLLLRRESERNLLKMNTIYYIWSSQKCLAKNRQLNRLKIQQPYLKAAEPSSAAHVVLLLVWSGSGNKGNSRLGWLAGWLSRYNKISQWSQNKWVGEYTDHDILPALWLWLRTTIQSMLNLMKIKMLSILFKNHAVWSNIQMGLLSTGCSIWGLGKSWGNLNYFIKWKIRNTTFQKSKCWCVPA